MCRHKLRENSLNLYYFRQIRSNLRFCVKKYLFATFFNTLRGAILALPFDMVLIQLIVESEMLNLDMPGAEEPVAEGFGNLEKALKSCKCSVGVVSFDERLLNYDGDHAGDVIILYLGAGYELDIQIMSTFIEKMTGPVILHLCEYDEVAELMALRSGICDVLHAGMSPNVIAERIKAADRRRGWNPVRGPQNVELANENRISPCVVDPDNNELWIDEWRIELTMAEIVVIQALVVRNGAVASRHQLKNALERLLAKPVHERAVDSHIKRIRKKLCQYGAEQMIKTVYGLGYRFVPQASAG